MSALRLYVTIHGAYTTRTSYDVLYDFLTIIEGYAYTYIYNIILYCTRLSHFLTIKRLTCTTADIMSVEFCARVRAHAVSCRSL